MSLPADILYHICEHLRLSQDFDTLFQCSLVSRNFAAAALPNLWRIHDAYTSATTEESFDLKKWVTLWRSLVLSSFPGATYAPYVLWIRVLSPRDLDDLFHDRYFRTRRYHGFFDGELQKFDLHFKKMGNAVMNSTRVPHAAETAILIIEHLMQYLGDTVRSGNRNSLLEELDCRVVSSDMLHKWLPRIPGLRSLRIWEGTALKGVGSTICQSCPKFDSLTFYAWSPGTVDEDFAEFLNELQPQTLKHLESISYTGGEELTVAALGKHNESLQTLKLSSLLNDFIQAMPMIGPCGQLRVLQISLQGHTTSTVPEIKKEIGNWISSCKSMREISIRHSLTDLGPEVLIPVLQSEVRLVKLDLRYYSQGESTLNFHRALASQATSLEFLTLHGDMEPEKDVLVRSISQLEKLQELHLRDVSDLFSSHDIIRIASKLLLLQELTTSGMDLGDEIWPSFSTLRFLRRLDINAYSAFTKEGILGYVDTLGEGNQGMVLGITMADPFFPLSVPDQEEIGAVLTAKVDGRFEYIPGRDPDAQSDSDSEDE